MPTAALRSPQRASRATAARIPSVDSSLDEVHPILGNFNLPVEIEDAPKPSGTHNLSREGWDEDKCRNYLVRVLDWIPRNFNYEDGLRLIHPQLQERFGDENVDLACGVLEELIEVESPSPFPESVYQRWKHRHRNRHDDLQLPHAPHTSTIMAQVVPTETLLKWRTKNSNIRLTSSTSIPKSPSQHSASVSPTSPAFSTSFSSISHVDQAWRIEHSIFVSVGGCKASVLFCPSPQAFHSRLWDPSFGRGGTLVGERSVFMKGTGLSDTASHEEKTCLSSLEGSKMSRTPRIITSWRDLIRYQAHYQDKLRAATTEIWHELMNKREGTHSSIGSDVALPNNFVPLPRGARIPNAAFARKHHLVPEGEPLPSYLLKAWAQPTADQLSLQQCEHLCKRAIETAESLHKFEELEENNKREVRELAVKSYLSHYKGPPTPGLFFDTGLDFIWDTGASSGRLESSSTHGSTAKSSRTRRKDIPYQFINSMPRPYMSPDLNASAQEQNDHQSPISRTVNETPRINTVYYKCCKLTQILSIGSIFSRILKSTGFPVPEKSPSLDERASSVHADVELNELHVSSRGIILSDCCPKQNLKSQLHRFPVRPRPHVDPPLIAENAIKQIRLPANRSVERVHTHTPLDTVKGMYCKRSAVVDVEKLPRLEPRTDYFWRASPHPARYSENFTKENRLVRTGQGVYSSLLSSENRQMKVEAPASSHLTTLQDEKLTTFDGVGDEIHHHANNNRKPQNTVMLHNTIHKENSSAFKILNSSMDRDNGFGRLPTLPPTKPLHVHEHIGHLHISPSQKQLENKRLDQNCSEELLFPPRTSSIGKLESLNKSEAFVQPGEGEIDTSSIARTSSRSTLSSYKGYYLSGASFEAPSTSINTARSTLSNYKPNYTSNTSSGIMGDFVPLDSIAPVAITAVAEGNKARVNTSLKSHNVLHTANPYEFEPGSPYYNESQLTTFGDFIGSDVIAAASSPRPSHTKQSHSESNAIYEGTRIGPATVSPSKPADCKIQRSESSPSVLPLRYPARHEKAPSPERSHYKYPEEEMSYSSRGRERSKEITGRGRRCDEEATSYSPSRIRRQVCAGNSNSSAHSKDITSSPTKVLEDFFDQGEFDDRRPNRSPSPLSPPPQKRSRSPMKKMFGENGWLGNSPNFTPQQNLKSKKSTITGKDEFSAAPKKTTMMGKIKNKLEEFAEKADLSPIRVFRSDHEKHPKLSLLTVSLRPPEQARIYMEVELMLVHTANTFLMVQFRQGRIAVDSIKKTVDLWKSKGRPLVIEFMYDQATQRDLVAANHHNFRFHGDRAGDDVRVNSMLYNWKQVASLMAIRTFCNADTVILKLLFDIEQILELLGAGEPILLRLQQIRAPVNEMMRISRHRNNFNEAAPSVSRGRASTWDLRPTGGSTSHGQCREESYGGLQLAPDSPYRE